ncbi:hypothetical protein [Dactylosporangium sp. CS-033363]|uniref:hypothetical protein n=1 Tax=Dactylosporangium sp. CS-033363 TaxID=3239935 RepID=UPI003D8DB498
MSGKYAIHRSRSVNGTNDPDTGTAVSASLWMLEDGPTNLLLEFADGTDEGADLTEVQALELVTNVSHLLAVSAGAR